MTIDTTISPEKQDRLRQLFARGSEQMAKANYEYADNIYFTECVLNDPGNSIYCKTFLANLRKKYNDKKKTTKSYLANGKKAVSSKKPENVFKAGIEAIKANPWDIESLVATGEACMDLGYQEAAVEYYRAAVDADPRHAKANYACCEVLREIADYDGALACIQRILKYNPADRDAPKIMQDLIVEKTIHKGRYAMGESRQTHEIADSTIPDGEDVMGRALTFEEQIERRIAKNPQDTVNYVELAQWFYQQSNFAKAEECYARAVNVSKNAPDMVERLLDAQKQRLHADAVRLKEEYEKDSREETKAEFLTARERFEAKNMELARHRIQFYPNHTGYRYDYGILLQKNGQFKEAIAEFQLAKAEGTRRGECLLALGQCFQMIKQNKLAMSHYHEAVSVLEMGDSKKKALYLAMKLAFVLEDLKNAEEYGHQLAAIDFAYRDLSEILDQIAQKRSSA